MEALLATAGGMPGLTGAIRKDWEKTCRHVSRPASGDRVRVAVVGAIKSGKSTFINSFLKGDYLKRGAGVVTSIVTRVRKGKGLKATLVFKSWDEIHADLEHAMVLLPSIPVAAAFDLRRPECRAALQAALAALGPDRLIVSGTRNESSVLMDAYLKGFESVRDIISEETVVRHYEGGEFLLHRDFAGSDSLAVYLKDIEIEINADMPDESLEMADCQGSDSPNPLHLAMIQDYLLLTHLIIYVISSRTGLRQADIRFLSMIRKMGLAGHILFVVNCDFSEHDSLDGLLPLIERIREEISLIKPSPRIYALSCLYNLFEHAGSGLSDKDRARQLLWREEAAFAAFSDGETKRFAADLEDMLLHERYALLLRNPVERLSVISAGVDHWIGVNLEMLSRDAAGAAGMLENIKRHEARILQLKTLVKTTLDGALQKIKQDLKTDVDRFFDVRTGEVFSGMLRFIRQYAVADDPFQGKTPKPGFTQALFLVFQEFRHSLDTFVTETAMPEVIRFIREEEEKIAACLQMISAPYDGLLQDALSDHGAAAEGLSGSLSDSAGFSPDQGCICAIRVPELDAVKSHAGLRLPSAGVTLRYSARIKTEAVAKLGCYTLVTLVKRLLKKSTSDRHADALHALKDGVDRMKRETERSIVSHFTDYRENLKFQYVYKLADAAIHSLLECLLAHFDAYSTDISRFAKGADVLQSDKDLMVQALKELRAASREIAGRLQGIREQMDGGACR